jgi:hypothetical protein
MEIARAKAVCLTAQAIIDTARVEVKYIAVTGQGDETPKKFFNTEASALPPVTFSSRKTLAS